MSIPLLRELHDDVRRLVIAGAGISVDDIRLKRVLPQLQQYGEKAPIFKRVAEVVAGVTGAQPEHAAGKLLDLAVLLHAVLHTQSTTEAAGELIAIGLPGAGAAAKVAVMTNTPYRKLQPLIEALTQRGPGRLEIIRQSAEDGLFIDTRTFIPAVNALKDSYSEIADYIAEQVMPIIGVSALPILHAQFDMHGGSGDARMLTAIFKLSEEADELWPILSSAAKEGALPVRLAAIALAAGLPGFEDDLLELSHDRKKEVRSAALLALSSNSSDKAVDRLMDALTKKDTEIATVPIQKCESARLTELLLNYGKELIEPCISADKDAGTREKLGAVVACFQTKAKDFFVREFIMKALDNDQLDAKEMESAWRAAAGILLETKDKIALAFLHELRERRPHLIGYSFKAAFELLKPTELFDRYEGYLSQKRSQNSRELLQAIYEYTPDPIALVVSEQAANKSIVWDTRWIQRLVELNEEELVCRLVKRPDKIVVSYLVEKSKVAPQLMKPRTVRILFALFRLGYNETPEILMSALEGTTQKSFYYLDQEIQLLIAMLPNSYADRLHEIADKINYEYVRNQMKELADHLAAKPAEVELKEEGAGFAAWIKNKLS